LPSGLPGIIRGGDGTGLLDVGGEGISQLPPVEVVGELLPEDERYRAQRPPSATQQGGSGGSGGGGGGGALNAGQFIRRRRSPLASLLPNDQGLLGDLGSGVVFIEDLPYQWLQPSALARGGLIRFKKA